MLVVFSASALGQLLPGPDKTILLEAESFTDHGGWLLDQQYMDQMGSPVLLAHGIGKPVADAQTEVLFPAAGTYRVYVRTRNWMAPWSDEFAPGTFQLSIDAQKLETVFGNEGNAWHWQSGGTIDIRSDRLRVTVALHDLTGFDGRIDAICFTADTGDPPFVPPDEAKSLVPLRRRALGLPEKVPDAEGGPFDLVVVGGGYPGICAAITAARLNLKVALIQDRPYVGGNASPEIRVGLQGNICLPPYPNLGNLVYQLKTAAPLDYESNGKKYSQKEMRVVAGEKNIKLFLEYRMYDVEMNGKTIQAVYAKCTHTGKELRISGHLFADCTGDGNLGALAGADFRVGRESKKETGESMAPDEPDKLVMGSTLIWRTEDVKKPTRFPELPWAVQFTSETIQPDVSPNWNWETGMNKDQVNDIEWVRDLGFRAIYGHWAYMKNHADANWAPKTATRELILVPHIAGKRESRRLLGDLILQEQDFRENRAYPDACVTCTWPIDLHYANDYSKKHFPGNEFRTYCTHEQHLPYPIPYRCFYSRNIPNLFMAGRDISVTHVALGPTRVMQSGGMMGEVVGMAASLCVRHETLPRAIYETHLEQLKSLCKDGIAPRPPKHEFMPRWLPSAGPNLARSAKVAASSEHVDGTYPVKFVNDGRIVTHSDRGRWVSRNGHEHWVTLTFKRPTTVSAMHLVSGQAHRNTPIGNFVLQYKKNDVENGDWIDIPESRNEHNPGKHLSKFFSPTTSKEFRLLIKTSGDMARIWELELYNCSPGEH